MDSFICDSFTCDIVVESLDHKTDNSDSDIEDVYSGLSEDYKQLVNASIVSYYHVTNKDIGRCKIIDMNDISSDCYEMLVNRFVTAKAVLITSSFYGIYRSVLVYKNSDKVMIESETDTEVSLIHYVYTEILEDIKTFSARDFLYANYETTNISAHVDLDKKYTQCVIKVTTENVFINSQFNNVKLILFSYLSNSL